MAAKNYTEILALVNAGNQMGLSNTIKRDYGIPLDFTSVQPSYNDAVIYAAENTKAYVGQPLSVGGKLYIINDVAAAEKHVVGEKEYDNYLVEVGSATEGDGVTIDLEEGVLTLHGFESALTGYLPRKAEDGSLEWVPISAVVQGDGNKVTTLTSEDGSVTIEKKTDTDESLVYDLSVEAYDDSDLQTRVKAIEDDYLKEADKYDDSDLQNRVKAIEDDYLKGEDKYDDTDLKNRVSDLEDIVGDTESGLVKDLADEVARAKEAEQNLQNAIDAIDFVDTDELEEVLTPINNLIATKAAQTDLEALEDRVDAFLTGTGAEDALDSLQELIEYINTHDDVEINSILASIQALENKLVLGTYVDGEETKEYATVKAYVEAAIEAIKIGDYAKAADLAGLAGRVAVLEAKPFDTYATKTEATYTSGDTNIVIDNRKVSLSSQLEGIANIMGGANQINIGAQAGVRLGGEFASVEVTSSDVLLTSGESGAVKVNGTEIGALIKGTKVDNAGHADEAVKAEKDGQDRVITETYAEKATTLAGYGIGDAYTKDEINAKIGVPGTPAVKDEEGNVTTEAVAGTGVYQHIYSKDEVTALIADITGGESAADVLAALNAYKTTNDAVVKDIKDVNTAQDLAIEAAQKQADKGVTDAAAAKKTADEAAALAETNKTDIAGHLARIQVLETAKGDHETRIATAEGQITALIGEDAAINEAIGVIDGQIIALQAEDARLAGLISANTTEIGKKANADDVYTKGEIDTTIQGINTELDKKLVASDLADYAKSADVANTYATIAALEEIYKAGSGVEGEEDYVAPTGLLAVEIARAKAAEKKISDDLALLIENPTEALDSVKELIEHVTAHGTAVEGIITRLDGHDTALEAVDGRLDALEAKPDYTLPAATVDALGGVKLSDEIGLDANQKLEIKKVSTDLLVQGEEELVLFGGNSGAATQA